MRIAPRQAQAYERKDLPRVITTKPLPKLAAVEPTGGVPFDKSKGCMWPLWGLESTIGNVCGCDQYILDPGTKRERASSYCEAHHRRAYPGTK